MVSASTAAPIYLLPPLPARPLRLFDFGGDCKSTLMVRLSEGLLVRRAEHNDGSLTTLQEISLHSQGLERIEVINQACRHLRILYLQNNVICHIQNLHRLKELEELNLALNNITRVQNLQRCESLRRLDLTANFLDRAGLLLQQNERLEELHLLGNPCTQWAGYRALVVGTLPGLKLLDGQQVLPSERIAAAQQLKSLEEQLRSEVLAEGIDPDEAAQVEDDSPLDADAIPETGSVGEDGSLRRPWCPATRILEQREAEAQAAAQEAARQADRERAAGLFGEPQLEPPLRQQLPDIVEGQPVYQKNEGKWEYRIEETADGRAVQVDVAFGRYLDTSAIQADIQPSFVRLLAKGRLLQLSLPAEVRPDASVAQRSKVTGNLLITMPLADETACLRPAPAGSLVGGLENAAGACNRASQRSSGGRVKVPKLPPAAVSLVGSSGGGASDEDDLPSL